MREPEVLIDALVRTTGYNEGSGTIEASNLSDSDVGALIEMCGETGENERLRPMVLCCLWQWLESLRKRHVWELMGVVDPLLKLQKYPDLLDPEGWKLLLAFKDLINGELRSQIKYDLLSQLYERCPKLFSGKEADAISREFEDYVSSDVAEHCADPDKSKTSFYELGGELEEIATRFGMSIAQYVEELDQEAENREDPKPSTPPSVPHAPASAPDRKAEIAQIRDIFSNLIST